MIYCLNITIPTIYQFFLHNLYTIIFITTDSTTKYHSIIYTKYKTKFILEKACLISLYISRILINTILTFAHTPNISNYLNTIFSTSNSTTYKNTTLKTINSTQYINTIITIFELNILI